MSKVIVVAFSLINLMTLSFSQEVPPEHLQAVLPRVRQGHWIPEAGLELVAPLFRKQ